MYSYPKIDNLYKRDINGSKKLLEGEFKNQKAEYLQNNEWICTEKIDGTNIGVVWDGYRVSFQGRTEKSKIPEYVMNPLEEIFGGSCNEEIFEQIFGDKKAVLYGEAYGPKIQACGAKYRKDVTFILFDVYFPENNSWFFREELEKTAKAFNIDLVPIVFKGNLKDAADFVKSEPDSTFGTAKMEGVVAQPSVEVYGKFGQRIRVKIKAEDFK